MRVLSGFFCRGYSYSFVILSQMLQMGAPVPKKPRSDFFLRDDLLKEDTVNHIKSTWGSSVNVSSNGVEILSHPFPVCIVQNVIINQELLKQAVVELKDIKFYQKSNDLYQFMQSDDVRNLINGTFVPQLYQLVKTDLRLWVDKILGGNKLKEEISATFSLYTCQDRLLCHDDKCEDRHIAFILYLTEDWHDSDGGNLQLFNTDTNGYPFEVVKTIKPLFNSLVFFEVTHHSFHQVTEVLSAKKKRLSLNGWFHSSEKKLEETNCLILELPKTLGNEEEFNLDDYFLFTYLNNMNKLDIKAIFATESEIQLDEFLVQKFCKEIHSELKSESVKWVPKGPANIRKYEVADPSSLPPSLSTLKKIFESKCWFRYLKSITGLDFAPSKWSDLEVWRKGVEPHCNFEIQKWTKSCYTLIHDQDPEFHSEALDVVLRLPHESSEVEEDGQKDVPEAGHMVYIDADSKEEECLLHIGNKMNSLGLVFRDRKTIRFTKYLHQSAIPFYQIFCTYRQWRPPEDQPTLKHCQEEEEASDNGEEEEEDEVQILPDKKSS